MYFDMLGLLVARIFFFRGILMEFKLRFTAKEITAWGGMGLMKQMLDRVGFAAAVESCGLPKPGSNRVYVPSQLILQFM